MQFSTMSLRSLTREGSLTRVSAVPQRARRRLSRTPGSRTHAGRLSHSAILLGGQNGGCQEMTQRAAPLVARLPVRRSRRTCRPRLGRVSVSSSFSRPSWLMTFWRRIASGRRPAPCAVWKQASMRNNDDRASIAAYTWPRTRCSRRAARGASPCPPCTARDRAPWARPAPTATQLTAAATTATRATTCPRCRAASHELARPGTQVAGQPRVLLSIDFGWGVVAPHSGQASTARERSSRIPAGRRTAQTRPRRASFVIMRRCSPAREVGAPPGGRGAASPRPRCARPPARPIHGRPPTPRLRASGPQGGPLLVAALVSTPTAAHVERALRALVRPAGPSLEPAQGRQARASLELADGREPRRLGGAADLGPVAGQGCHDGGERVRVDPLEQRVAAADLLGVAAAQRATLHRKSARSVQTAPEAGPRPVDEDHGVVGQRAGCRRGCRGGRGCHRAQPPRCRRRRRRAGPGGVQPRGRDRRVGRRRSAARR